MQQSISITQINNNSDLYENKKVNYYSLILSILKGLSVDESLYYMQTGKRSVGNPVNVSKETIGDLRKEGYTYRKIAEIYDVDVSTIYKRYNGYEKTQNKKYKKEQLKIIKDKYGADISYNDFQKDDDLPSKSYIYDYFEGIKDLRKEITNG